jgi:aryl-alcohol dehydrogenase
VSTASTAALAVPGEHGYRIADIVLDDPREHEVLVRVVAAGMCHTDATVKERWAGADLPPIVLGHEGAGVVERVGAAVRGIAPGDKVLMTFNSCGDCGSCRTGYPSYCDQFNHLNLNPAGTPRPGGGSGLSLPDGTPLGGGFFGQSSFAAHALASDRNVLVVDAADEDELAALAPFGCGLQTGAGAVFNEARPRPGQALAVFGAGAVGLAAVLAAALTPAAVIVAVDVVPSRLELARALGATHTVNGAEEDVTAALRRITGGSGINAGIETTGVPAVQRAAVDALSWQGTLLVIGAQFGADFATPATGLLKGRSVHGIVEGSSDIYTFLPALIGLYRAGRFPADRLIRQYPLDQIDQAAADSHSGVTVKPVIRL